MANNRIANVKLQQIQKVRKGFRITIFEEARKKLGLEIGDYVIVRLEGDSLKIFPFSDKEWGAKCKEAPDTRRGASS